MKLDEFDLLSKDPIYIDGIGNIKIPQLQDIRKIGYKTYETMCNYLSIDFYKYLELSNLKEKYDGLDDVGKSNNTFYKLILGTTEFLQIYYLIFSFFISDDMELNAETESFEFYKTETYEDTVSETIKTSKSKFICLCRKLFKKIDILKLFKHKSDEFIIDKKAVRERRVISGVINNDNFDSVRDVLLQINKLKDSVSEAEPPKYKNEMARKLAERMAKAEQKKQEKDKENMSFGKMISKYCADNKNGINILNVWEMTIYQFYDQFMQHNHIRQSDIQDMVYANTVSFSDLKSYDSQLWLK